MYLILLAILIVSIHSMVMDNLKVAYQWKMLDFTYLSKTDKQKALQSGRFFPEDNVPTGIEIFEDRLFVTIPRLRPGVAASLAYINLTESPIPMNSPKLVPYPNWEAHKIRTYEDPPEIVSPFRIRADRCGRLWVLDTGFIDTLQKTIKMLSKPRLLIYDLRTDQLLRSYTIPDDQTYNNQSGFVNIAVEDEDCQDSYAYLAEIFRPGLIVYSYKLQMSWLVKHHYFNINPLAGNMSVGEVKFVWSEGIFGLALSRADSQGYSILYFHPITSFDEFAVSTKVLRNKELATNSTLNFHEFRRLGTRGEKGQSGVSYLDKTSNIIFFSLIHLNAVICWRVTNLNYTTTSHSRVFWNNETMIFPSDIKVDANNILWVLSNKLPMFMHDVLDYSKYNFRILYGKVSEAIKGTACESKMVANKSIIDTLNKVLNKDKPSPSSCANSPIYILSIIAVLAADFILN